MTYITNLQEVLIKQKNNDSAFIVFYSHNGLKEILSYKDIYNNSLRLLAYLQVNGSERGSHLVFQISDPKNFVITFWACILGGIIPVPLSVATKDQEMKKVYLVWDCLDKPFLCIEKQEVLEKLQIYASNQQLEKFYDDISSCNINLEDFNTEISSNDLGVSCEDKIANIEPNDTAFIQFSSGSTGSPKGVVLTHNNLIANIKGIAKSSKMTKNECHLSWLPLTHDMGLICAHLTASLLGARQVLISTDLFAKNPKVWMEKASQHRANVLYTPNYGLKILMHSLGCKIFNWDLSCVRLILTGAEPISLKLCNNFVETLSPYKLNKNAICPAYGLAEASVAVSISVPGRSIKAYYLDRNYINLGEPIREVSSCTEDAMIIVDVGAAVENCNFCIKDLNGKNLPDETIGIIHIKGQNVTKGYINNLAETRKTLSKDGWLNTGDLGFIKDSNLVVAGRKKEVIFANGINIYPHDIESACSDIELSGFKSRNLVVSSVYNSDDEEEQLVLFVRYKSNLQDFALLADKLKRHINKIFRIKILAVVPIDAIPRTTSGKICRYKLKVDFTSGVHDEILKKIEGYSANNSPKISQPLENSSVQEIKQLLAERLETFIYDLMSCKIHSRDDNLIEMGIGSLQAIKLKNTLQLALNIDVPVSVVFDYPTINRLVDFLITKYTETAISIPNGSYNEPDHAVSYN